ncbi:unnamed protein product [Microthlaspi erraticum]|uniref:Mitochondrial import inner membrane translocase subunit TIM50 n=1 Tax=Microthlaspi erraticum TaxID=1685480 RepID=A0A6D2KIX4_9BRAS|nr:unnamed protein product [Microthlaspi erraticum]
MRPIEHCVEEEPVIKKARMINTVEQAPLLDMEVKDETCVASIAVEEGKDSCVEENESNERKIEEVSALSLADPKHVDLEMEVKEVDVVSGDANVVKLPFLELEKENAACVTSRDETPPVIDSCVASGGMKEETGSIPSVLKKKLLVLDLNGLLAAIVSPVADCKADINIGRRAIFKRPFCEDFLNFCFDKFEVGIWSSRKKNNVDRITEFLLGDMKKKLLFCWDMAYCSTTTVGSLENRHKFVVFKDLNQLWQKHDPTLPWQKGDYNETNTVLLDDSPYKALLNPPYTAIFPQSYNHLDKTDASLGSGGDLRLHLEKLEEAENVQDFIKKNPFGQEAITEASESWEFYRQAIGNVRERRI